MDPNPVCPERLDPDPVCPEWLDPDPVCPERLDPDPDTVNIRPDPKPYVYVRLRCVPKFPERSAGLFPRYYLGVTQK